jgi:hypothetical protein
VLDGLGGNTAIQFVGGRLQVEKLGPLPEPPLMKEFRALIDAMLPRLDFPVTTWGGGQIASADGLRFVVPVANLHTGHNPIYFGRQRGVTWLNVVIRAMLQLMQHSA